MLEQCHYAKQPESHFVNCFRKLFFSSLFQCFEVKVLNLFCSQFWSTFLHFFKTTLNGRDVCGLLGEIEGRLGIGRDYTRQQLLLLVVLINARGKNHVREGSGEL